MSLAESQLQASQLSSELTEGLSILSNNQVVKFELYAKVVLPLDGYVFWLKSTLLNTGSQYGNLLYGSLVYGNSGIIGLPPIIEVKGSLHYATEIVQESDKNISINHVIFTTNEEIKDFNSINPNLMYVADVDGIKFSFSRTANFYKEAALFHYRGDAVYSIMDSQLIDSINNFDISSPIVSNSLPLWLSLNKYFQMYPAFLSPQNIGLPYATVDIIANETQAIQVAPYFYSNSSHYQLVKDTVKIQITGVRNSTALEFQDYVFDYSRNTDAFGLMNIPTIRDEKITQREIGVIAMRKSITFEISYYQQNILDIATKLITSAIITIQET